MTATERLLADLAQTLRGSRRARRRLLDEVREDLHDAVHAEREAGLDAAAAEQVVAAQFGSPQALAARWNSDRAQRSGALRRNVVLVLVATLTAGALGITQYASGKSPPPSPRCVDVGVRDGCDGGPQRQLHPGARVDDDAPAD